MVDELTKALRVAETQKREILNLYRTGTVLNERAT